MQGRDDTPPANDRVLSDAELTRMLMLDEPNEDEARPSLLDEAKPAAATREPTIEELMWALGVDQSPPRRSRPSLLSPELVRTLTEEPKAPPPPPKPLQIAPPEPAPIPAVPTPALRPQAAPPPPARPSQVPVVRQPLAKMYLGDANNEVPALRAMVIQRHHHLVQQVKLQNMRLETALGMALMDLDDYIFTVDNFRAMRADLLKQRAANLPLHHPDYAPHVPMFNFKGADRPFVLEPVNPKHTPDVAGWLNYLRDKQPKAIEQTLKGVSSRAEFPESGRQEHTLILGPSRWGKSELMKAMLHHYATDGSAAVVVLDPGGDLVKQVSRWPELLREDRLRLIQPGLEGDNASGTGIGKGLTVGFNPLDGTGLDVEERRVVAADWAHTLGMIGAKTNDLSPSMVLLVTMCVQVLLAVPGATLDDLGHMLMLRPKVRGGADRPEAPHPRAAELQKLARNYPVRRVAEFFRYQYDTDGIEGTREALRRRIETVMNYPHAEAMLTGEATLNLAEEIEARRFVLVDLSRFKKAGGAAIGRLIVAQVAAIGRRRESQDRRDRTPTHLFIDEASTMISASMFEVIKELRKFGIFMTLGQQVGGDEMAPEQKAILKISTGCKLIAPASVVGDWIELPPKEVPPALDRHEFAVSWAGVPGAHKVRVRSDLADQAHGVEPWEWRRHLEEITGPGGYYRPAALAETIPLEEAADSPAQPRQRGQRRANVPDDVPPELTGKFTSKTGRESDW